MSAVGAGGETLLRQSQRALTANQRVVLDELTAERRPLTAYQLLDRLRGHGFAAPPTVYRALERLLALGLVHRIESLNAYVACPHGPHETAAVFAICRGCGAVVETPAEAILHSLSVAADQKGFAVDEAHVELLGRCRRCRAT